jgi:pimeloyl-ACP methyl ester carboxylesterase
VLQAGSTAVASGRARGLYADLDRLRRARSSDDSEINLDSHIKDIVGVIHYEEMSDVVLCGHSYGGMVITGVAEQIAAKIRSLVYLDAFVPENRKSVFDYLPPEQSGEMRNDAAQNGEGYNHAYSGLCFRGQCPGRQSTRCASSSRWRR